VLSGSVVGKESTFGKEMDGQSTISPILLLASRYLVGGLEHFLFSIYWD